MSQAQQISNMANMSGGDNAALAQAFLAAFGAKGAGNTATTTAANASTTAPVAGTGMTLTNSSLKQQVAGAAPAQDQTAMLQKAFSPAEIEMLLKAKLGGKDTQPASAAGADLPSTGTNETTAIASLLGPGSLTPKTLNDQLALAMILKEVKQSKKIQQEQLMKHLSNHEQVEVMQELQKLQESEKKLEQVQLSILMKQMQSNKEQSQQQQMDQKMPAASGSPTETLLQQLAVTRTATATSPQTTSSQAGAESMAQLEMLLKLQQNSQGQASSSSVPQAAAARPSSNSDSFEQLKQMMMQQQQQPRVNNMVATNAPTSSDNGNSSPTQETNMATLAQLLKLQQHQMVQNQNQQQQLRLSHPVGQQQQAQAQPDINAQTLAAFLSQAKPAPQAPAMMPASNNMSYQDQVRILTQHLQKQGGAAPMPMLMGQAKQEPISDMEEEEEAAAETSAAAAAVVAPTKRRRRGRTGTFPQKLHQMLDDMDKNGTTDIASFLPHGKGFAIHRNKDFAKLVMPKYFKMGSFASFQRQLNLYDFNRVADGPDRGAYHHELFIRGKPLLSTTMRRTKIKGNNAK